MGDPSIVAVAITGVIGIAMAIIAKLRCFFVSTENEETGTVVHQTGCGFTEASIYPSSSRVEQISPEDGGVLIFRR